MEYIGYPKGSQTYFNWLSKGSSWFHMKILGFLQSPRGAQNTLAGYSKVCKIDKINLDIQGPSFFKIGHP